MKCSRPRFALRPLVENLESRLQPGSVLTGPGYGWSFLADNLSILKQDSWESQRRVSSASSESSKPTPSIVPTDVQNQSVAIAVARVATPRIEALSQPILNLFDDLAASLTNDDLLHHSVTGQEHPLPLATGVTAPAQAPPPATPAGSVPTSPVGVATPAQALATSTPAAAATIRTASAAPTGLQAVPIHAHNLATPAVPNNPSVQLIPNVLQTVPINLGGSNHSGSGASNQASINFLSYLGGTGPDVLSSLMVRSEGGNNFIYAAGWLTDSTGRVDAFVAKLTDGATAVVWADLLATSSPGPDRAFGLGFEDNSVYVVGTLADAKASLQTDAFIAILNASTGALGNNVAVPNATAAAVTTDAAGNVDVGGSIGDTTTASRRNLAIAQVSSDLSNLNFFFTMPLQVATASGLKDASSAITRGSGVSLADNGPSGRETGGGLIVDAGGNLYFAGTLTALGSTDNLALYGRVNAAGTDFDWVFYFDNTDLNGSLSPGPGGQGSAVAFDSSGNVVFTGSMNDNGGTPLNQDLILGRVAQAPDSDGGANILDANQIYVDNRIPPTFARVGDWTGNDLTVLADGTSVVTGAAYDPAAGTGSGDSTSKPTKGIDVHVTHFLTDDATTVQNTDEDPENVFGGSGTDVGAALTFSPGNANLIYVVGTTNSKDLPTTSGVIIPTYGGNSTTGFVGQVSIT